MQEPEEKREQILNAALEVFAEKGFHKATVSEVAEKAHIGKGTLYLYFPGKEALLVSILDRLIDRLLSSLETLPEDQNAQSAVQQWLSGQPAGRRTGSLIPQFLAQQLLLSSLPFNRKRGLLLNQTVERVAGRIRVAIDRGTIRPVNPTLAACLFLCLPVAVPFYGVARPDANLSESMPDIAEGITDMLWSGLRKESHA